MTRRSHVVRTADKTGPGTPRDLGGVQILCSTANAPEHVNYGDYSYNLYCRLTLEVGEDYERVFVAATIDDVRAYDTDISGPSDLFVAIFVHGYYGVNTEIFVPAKLSNTPVCLTGAMDLAAGAHDIAIHLNPVNYGPTVDCGLNRAHLQVIRGQTVSQPGCVAYWGCN